LEEHAVFSVVVDVCEIRVGAVVDKRELAAFGLVSVGIGVNRKNLD
jgi:hypothetical protein